MRIAVMGAGGQGGYFGGMLDRVGEDVTFIARGAHLEAMRNHGLTVKSRLAGDFTLPVKATDNPAEIGPVDLVMFCVKTYDTDSAAKQIKPIIGADTMVVSTQNGVDSEERIERVMGPGRFIACVNYVNSVIEKPGVIDVRFAGMTSLGELDGNMTPRMERLTKTFERAGIKVELRSDIRAYLWEKFVAFCGFGSVEVLTRLPAGPIRACPETTDLWLGASKEVVEVARARGVPLSDGFLDQFLELVASLPSTHRASMYYDLRDGKRLELEALNGTVVRMGRELGVATPLNFAIYAALKPYADGAPAMPMGGQAALNANHT
jgi:2-dehydropantoate 2-reductase